MKPLFILLFTAVMITGCGKSNYTVYINNQSGTTFDSINVLISSSQGRSTTLLFTAVAPGQQVKQAVTDRAFYAKHDIGIWPTLYAKDTVMKNIGTYNDLGVFSLNYKMTIDSALKVKWEVW